MTAGPAIQPPATAPTPAPRRRRPRWWLVALLAAVVVVAAGVPIGLSLSAPRTARLCAADGSACTDLSAERAATPRYALLPIGADGRLRVENRALTGRVGVGVVAFLRSADPARATVLPATTPTGRVAAPRDATRVLRLTGVPGGARLVLVRTDGVPPADGDPAAEGDLVVSAHGVVAAPAAATLAPLFAARKDTSRADARRAGATVAEQLEDRAGAPARITASVRSGDGRLLVDWVLAPGGEEVTAVRVAVRPDGTDEPVLTHDAIAATGSLVVPGLDRGTRYLVDVAPVLRRDGRHLLGAAVEVTGVPDGAPAPAADTLPAAPAGWTPLIDQRFDREAPLGSFADVYPGWAWYDGMTDTSRETARPRQQVGLWDSRTTMSVRDGLLDCRLHTAGERPQVCALTPTPDDRIWHGQRYGRYSVRFSADTIPGYKIAWLLWPDSNEWPEGEIDFPEADLDGTITGSSHRNDGDPSDFAWFVDTAQRLGTGWHTATIDWRPGRLTFVLDGESWTTTDPAALPRVPMRWALQAETRIEDAAPDPDVSGHILIDWVAAWSRAD